MKGNPATKTRKKAMVEAMVQAMGVVSMACRSVELDRSTHYKWMKEDEEYRAAIDDIDSIVLDFAEHQLHKKIKQGNTAAIMFFLARKGKGRGYGVKDLEDVEVDDLEEKVIVMIPDNNRLKKVEKKDKTG